MSYLIRNSQTQITGYASRAFSWEHCLVVLEDTPPFEESTAQRTLLLLRNPLPRGHSSFREHRHSEINPSWARWPQQPTSLISAYIHGVCYVVGSSHVLNVATTPTSAQTVIEGSRNHSRNKEHNPDCYKKIATCRSCSYWNSHIPHCQWRLSGYIYTGRSTKKMRIKTSQEGSIPPTLPTRISIRKKKR